MLTFGCTTAVRTLTWREPSTESSERRSWLRSLEARTSSPVADGCGVMSPCSRLTEASRAGLSIFSLMRLTRRVIDLRL